MSSSEKLPKFGVPAVRDHKGKCRAACNGDRLRRSKRPGRSCGGGGRHPCRRLVRNGRAGLQDTLQVTMEDMVSHTAAVARAQPPQLVVADMPWTSYHLGRTKAVANAARLVRAGAGAVKLEGGVKRLDVLNAILDAEIPVVGHLGLTPQSVHAMGGYRVQGRQPGTPSCSWKTHRNIRSGVLRDRAGRDARRGGRRDHPGSPGADLRDRSRALMRRPGAGLPRHRRHGRPAEASICPPVRRPRGLGGRGSGQVGRRRARKAVPFGQRDVRLVTRSAL